LWRNLRILLVFTIQVMPTVSILMRGRVKEVAKDVVVVLNLRRDFVHFSLDVADPVADFFEQ